MKIVIFLCYLATAVLAVGEKQVQLEDIERENLANEKKLKQEKQGISKLVPSSPLLTQKLIPSTQFQYGFTPMKSAQKQLRPQQHFQFQQPQQYVYPQYNTDLAYVQVPQYHYQQYENVPYVADNQLIQNTKPNPQQYYEQQYVYVQPLAAPSNNIQMVVDSKGNVKYYMYVPNHYFSEVKNVATGDPVRDIHVQTIPPSSNNVGPQIFTREPDYRQQPKTEHQYITQPQLPPQPITAQPIQFVQPTPAAPQAIQYVQPTHQFISSQESYAKLIQPTQESIAQSQFVPSAQEPFPKSQYVPKGEPQSLLDSYVPSILQFQYYKQQQEAQANTIPDDGKVVVPRTTLTRQSIRIPNAESTYNFPLPSPYRTHTFKN